MAYPARTREALHLSAIYRNHPLFADPQQEIWSDEMPGAARLEGGDVLVIGRGAVLVGMGERTGPARWRLWPNGCSKPAQRARCSPWTCPSSAPGCTWTPC